MTNELKQLLSKDDLYLLMESYRNMIEMNSSIATQQKALLENQNKLIEKQKLLSEEQKIDTVLLNRISESCSSFTQDYKDLDKKISSEHEKINTFNVSIKELFDSHYLNIIKTHHTILNRIYISMTGMITIILALIAMGVALLDKYSLLKELQGMLNILTNSLK